MSGRDGRGPGSTGRRIRATAPPQLPAPEAEHAVVTLGAELAAEVQLEAIRDNSTVGAFVREAVRQHIDELVERRALPHR